MIKEEYIKMEVKICGINWFMGEATIIKIKNSDLVSSDEPSVTVISKRKKDRESVKKLAHLQTFYPLEQADPNTPPIVNRIFKRYVSSCMIWRRSNIFLLSPRC